MLMDHAKLRYPLETVDTSLAFLYFAIDCDFTWQGRTLGKSEINKICHCGL